MKCREAARTPARMGSLKREVVRSHILALRHAIRGSVCTGQLLQGLYEIDNLTKHSLATEHKHC